MAALMTEEEMMAALRDLELDSEPDEPVPIMAPDPAAAAAETKETTPHVTQTTRLAFNTAPAVIPSQQSERSIITNSLRSISTPRTKLEWCWGRVQMNGATFGTKVTYVHPLNKEWVVVVDMKTSPSYFLQPEFIPK